MTRLPPLFVEEPLSRPSAFRKRIMFAAVKAATIGQVAKTSGPPIEKNSLWDELYEKRSYQSSAKRPIQGSLTSDAPNPLSKCSQYSLPIDRPLPE
jgi:hypothetical protein